MVMGLTGSAINGFFNKNTSDGQRMAGDPGMRRVANSFHEILSILAVPVLLFCLILAACAAQVLLRLYKRANDPETCRKH